MSEQTQLPDTLTINGVVYVRAGVTVADECLSQTCTYFNHYLLYYRPDLQGEKLEHAAYHAAEKRCAIAQEAMFKWQDAHQHDDHYQEPAHLVKQCEFWERKVCA